MNANIASRPRLAPRVRDKDSRGVREGCWVEKMRRTTIKYMKFVYIQVLLAFERRFVRR
jgi:hypothetical protein